MELTSLQTMTGHLSDDSGYNDMVLKIEARGQQSVKEKNQKEHIICDKISSIHEMDNKQNCRSIMREIKQIKINLSDIQTKSPTFIEFLDDLEKKKKYDEMNFECSLKSKSQSALLQYNIQKFAFILPPLSFQKRHAPKTSHGSSLPQRKLTAKRRLNPQPLHIPDYQDLSTTTAHCRPFIERDADLSPQQTRMQNKVKFNVTKASYVTNRLTMLYANRDKRYQLSQSMAILR